MSDEIFQSRFLQARRVDAWHKKGICFGDTSGTSLVELGRQAGLDFQIEVVPLSANIQIPNPAYNPLDPAALVNMTVDEMIAAKAASEAGQFLTMQLPTNQNAIVMMPHLYNGDLTDARILGTGTDKYVPIQNMWLLEAFESVAKHYPLETMGVLKRCF